MGKKQKKRISVFQVILHAYLLAMFGAFPVFCSDGFFNIRKDRYAFFLYLSLGLLVLMCLLALSRLIGREEKPVKVQGKHLNITDWAMIALVVCCIVSTVFSKYPKDAFFGSAGRNHGTLMMLLYAAVYFVLSRNEDYHRFLFVVLGAVSAFIGLVSVLNNFWLDPLKMFLQLSPKDQEIFIATIGNKNFLASYFCITLPVLCTLFVQCANPFYLICAVFSAAGLWASCSDSGIMGLGVFLAVYLIWYASDAKPLKRFTLVCSAMFMAMMVLGLLQVDAKGTSILTPGISGIMLALMAAATAALHLKDKKAPDVPLHKAVRVSLMVLFALLLVMVLGAVVYFTWIDTDTPLSGVGALFRFNDDWGTHRGIMWNRAFRIYGEFPVWNKLFGSGPDTFFQEFSPYFPELYQYNEGSTNAAHNEYINYLITIGGAGLVSYLTAVISALYYGVKNRKQDAMAPVFCAAVICYGAQAVVNVAQPITTPLFFLFLALIVRKHPSQGAKL